MPRNSPGHWPGAKYDFDQTGPSNRPGKKLVERGVMDVRRLERIDHHDLELWCEFGENLATCAAGRDARAADDGDGCEFFLAGCYRGADRHTFGAVG